MTLILLADDNFELRFPLRFPLRLILKTRLGFKEIYEARDMGHVLAMVEDAPPDCVILDWELPGRPIRERISVLRTLVPNLKVIAISARPESKQDALAEGANAFISKTDQPDQMVEVIKKILAPLLEQ